MRLIAQLLSALSEPSFARLGFCLFCARLAVHYFVVYLVLGSLSLISKPQRQRRRVQWLSSSAFYFFVHFFTVVKKEKNVKKPRERELLRPIFKIPFFEFWRCLTYSVGDISKSNRQTEFKLQSMFPNVSKDSESPGSCLQFKYQRHPHSVGGFRLLWNETKNNFFFFIICHQLGLFQTLADWSRSKLPRGISSNLFTRLAWFYLENRKAFDFVMVLQPNKRLA